jgi:hypothetical protein
MIGGHGDAPIFSPLLNASNASYFFHNAGKHEALQDEPNIINPEQ